MPRTSKKPTTKKIYFYKVFKTGKGIPHAYPEWDWAEKITQLGSIELDERVIYDIIFEPEVLDGMSLLGMHKPLKPDFMSYLPKDADLTQSVFDIFESELPSEGALLDSPDEKGDGDGTKQTPADELTRFAHSSAVAFLNGGVIGLCTSSASAPQTRAVTNFLNKFFREEGMEWKSEPYVVEGDLKKFQEEVTGVRKASFKFHTAKDLLTPDDERRGEISFTEKFDEIADSLGGDFQIEISIAILPGSNNKQTRQRLRAAVGESLNRLVAVGSKLQVTGDKGSTLSEEELDILEHKLCHTIEIQAASLESKRFDLLKKEVAAHCKVAELPLD